MDCFNAVVVDEDDDTLAVGAKADTDDEADAAIMAVTKREQNFILNVYICVLVGRFSVC